MVKKKKSEDKMKLTTDSCDGAIFGHAPLYYKMLPQPLVRVVKIVSFLRFPCMNE